MKREIKEFAEIDEEDNVEADEEDVAVEEVDDEIEKKKMKRMMQRMISRDKTKRQFVYTPTDTNSYSTSSHK